MNAIRKAAILVVGFALAMFGFNMIPSASATNDPTPPPSTPTCVKYDTGTTVCTASSTGAAETSIETSDISAGSATSTGNATVVAYIQAGGATSAQMQGKHYKIKHAMTLRTSWRVNRSYGWHMKRYPKGYTFVKGSDGYWHDPACWNSVTGLPHGKKHLHMPKIKGKIIVVKSYALAQAQATAKSMALSTGWASATCTLNGTTAYGQSEYSLYGYALAIAYGEASSLAEARGAAVNGINKAKVGTDAQANATALTSVKAQGSAKAGANCSTSTTPPTPVPPTCESVYGPGYHGPDLQHCTKDGTSTPAPPPGSGGPNPPPSGGTGDPGSNECYSETTGMPVTPNPDGTCPVGSFGG